MQSDLSAMIKMNGSHIREDLRLAVGWWVIVTWGIFLVSFPTTLAFSIDGAKLAFVGCGIAGFVGGVFAIRNRSAWLRIIGIACVLLFLLYVMFWVSLMDKILAGETEKTLSQATSRIWQMMSMSVDAAQRHGGLIGTLATIYRELVMPVAQLLAVVFFIGWNLRVRHKLL
jgi:Ca2+/Na+ antiporter